MLSGCLSGFIFQKCLHETEAVERELGDNTFFRYVKREQPCNTQLNCVNILG